MERALGIPEKEIKKNLYTYVDNSEGGKVIFEYMATNILQADEVYKDRFGVSPEKNPNIGCRVTKATEATD